MPWQKNILHGICETDTKGLLTHYEHHISMARKNGKTTFAALVVLAFMYGPLGEYVYHLRQPSKKSIVPIPRVNPNFKIYIAGSAALGQANNVLAIIKGFINANEQLKSCTKFIASHSVVCKLNGNTIKLLSSRAAGAHGYEPDLWVLDELGQARDTSLYDALSKGVGTYYGSAIGLNISTVSTQSNCPMRRVITDALARQKNKKKRTVAYHYTADIERDDMFSDVAIAAANPSLSYILPRSLITDERYKAKNDHTQRLFWLAYRLNCGINVEGAAFDMHDWQKCARVYTEQDCAGQLCYLGLDLSSKLDLTALAAYFPETRRLLCHAWLPREGIEDRERIDAANYTSWHSDGWLTLCHGKVIDYASVGHKINEWCHLFRVENMRYDKWRVNVLLEEMRLLGVAMPLLVPFAQYARTFDPTIDDAQDKITQRILEHNDNPVLNYCIANTIIISDNKATVPTKKPGQISHTARIDGAIAALMAMAKQSIADPATYSPEATGKLIVSTVGSIH